MDRTGLETADVQLRKFGKHCCCGSLTRTRTGKRKMETAHANFAATPLHSPLPLAWLRFIPRFARSPEGIAFQWRWRIPGECRGILLSLGLNCLARGDTCTRSYRRSITTAADTPGTRPGTAIEKLRRAMFAKKSEKIFVQRERLELHLEKLEPV